MYAKIRAQFLLQLCTFFILLQIRARILYGLADEVSFCHTGVVLLASHALTTGCESKVYKFIQKHLI